MNDLICQEKWLEDRFRARSYSDADIFLLNKIRAFCLQFLDGPSTQHLRSLGPKTIPLMVFGTRGLKYWVLGPSGVYCATRKRQGGVAAVCEAWKAHLDFLTNPKAEFKIIPKQAPNFPIPVNRKPKCPWQLDEAAGDKRQPQKKLQRKCTRQGTHKRKSKQGIPESWSPYSGLEQRHIAKYHLAYRDPTQYPKLG